MPNNFNLSKQAANALQRDHNQIKYQVQNLMQMYQTLMNRGDMVRARESYAILTTALAPGGSASMNWVDINREGEVYEIQNGITGYDDWCGDLSGNIGQRVRFAWQDNQRPVILEVCGVGTCPQYVGGVPPDRLVATVAGIVNGTSTECTGFNGDWYLETNNCGFSGVAICSDTDGVILPGPNPPNGGGPCTTTPVFTSTAPLTANANVLYSYQLTWVDPDTGDVVTPSMDAIPLWASMDVLGLITGTPTVLDVGEHDFIARVTDLCGQFSLQAWKVTVSP